MAERLSTVRLGRRDYKLGSAVIVSKNKHIPIEITDVTFTTVGLLDNGVALSEGYNSVADLIGELRDFYPTISDESNVTVVRFEKR